MSRGLGRPVADPAIITETHIELRPMRRGEEQAVVDMVLGLAREAGDRVVPRLTPEALRDNSDLLQVTVAGIAGAEPVGACLTLMTFSTWRGARGVYVVDLFVLPHWRNRNLGEALLRAAAHRAHAQGAEFIKLEVDTANPLAGRFYDRLGFTRNDHDRLFVLEADRLKQFLD